MKDVRIRFAPSPTGIPHIGNSRIALFGWLYARKNNGRFILRIEDTDQLRLDPNSLQKIYDILGFLDLDWDEGPGKGGDYGPYIQSKRLDLYKEHALELVQKGYAYYCFCTRERLEGLRLDQQKNKLAPRYDRKCYGLSQKEIDRNLKRGMPYVIRLKMPDNEILKWKDLVQGDIEINSSASDDQVLIKSDGFPTYHLAVVVDDHLMKISHIFRGVEWISSTPKHIVLYRSFGWKMPEIAHFPLILGKDKSKLSKRHGAKSVLEYKEEGYLPEALINFLALLGWHPKDDKEILSREELINKFDLKGVQKQNAIFNSEKLDYLNAYYLKQKSPTDFALLLEKYIPELNFEQRVIAAQLLKDRITRLGQARDLIKFTFEDVDYSVDLLLEKTEKNLAKMMIKSAKEIISKTITKNISSDQVDKVQKLMLKEVKKNSWNTGDFFMVFRVAVAGSKVTPPILESLMILGREKTIERLDMALSKLAHS
jgi:glutamyl-tRNA synthetase